MILVLKDGIPFDYIEKPGKFESFIKRQNDSADYKIDATSLEHYNKIRLQKKIDTELAKNGIDERNQRILASNASQIALYINASLILFHTASSEEERNVIGKKLEKMRPMAQELVKSIEKTTVGYLGIDKQARKILKSSFIAKDAISNVLESDK